MDSSHKQQLIQNSACLFWLLFWAYLGVKIIFPLTLPFWLGLVVALLLKSVTVWLSVTLRFRRKSTAFSVILLFYILIGVLLWSIGAALFEQISGFIETSPSLYSNNIQPFFHRCALSINGVLDDFSPQTARALVEKSAHFSSSLSTAVADFSASTLSQVTSLAKKIPFWLLTIAFSILCSVFISIDYSSVMDFLLRQLPSTWRPILLRCKQQMIGSILQILKAYLILLLLTFLQLSLGFFLLKIEQPLLWAAVLAFLDFLPFIGTGLILIPWGIYHLIVGRAALGSGLLLLCGILTLVHNLLEPKLVSSSIGLHPLTTLIAMYAGLKLFGFIGLLMAPVLVLLLCFLQKEGCIQLYR